MPEITNTQKQPLIYVPLFVIVVLSMLKDYMEDYKRKKSDREENNREVDVFSESKFEKVLWKNLLIGQIIKVVKLYFLCIIPKQIHQDEFLPCDVILLSSSESKGICYIETKNLDGETNLKQKSVNKEFLSYFEQEMDFQVFVYKKKNYVIFRIRKSGLVMRNRTLIYINFQVISKDCFVYFEKNKVLLI